MRLLVIIPVYSGVHHVRLAIKSVVDKPINVLIIDNGAHSGSKKVMSEFVGMGNVSMITNEENRYFNPAFNQGIDYFLNSGYTHMVFMNSDLIMQDDWFEVLNKSVEVCGNDVSYVPHLGKPPHKPWNKTSLTFEPVETGIAGVFMFMSKKLARLVYPIPEEMKLWFGDTMFYMLVNGMGYSSIIVKELVGWHQGSRSMNLLKDKCEIVERDKKIWNETVKSMVEKRIESFVKI